MAKDFFTKKPLLEIGYVATSKFTTITLIDAIIDIEAKTINLKIVKIEVNALMSSSK